ncbi:MAG: PHP domain-containing protein [Spirochaetota bacterium]
MIDLHVHTTGSDGVCTPKELVELCLREKIDVVSVCDHDTVSSVDETMSLAASNGIVCVPGIELSCDYPWGDFHLLGYNINCTDSRLKQVLDYFNTQRDNRIDRMIENLNRHGIAITREMLQMDSMTTPGKPHIARALVAMNVVSSVDEAFATLLGRGMPGDAPKEKIKIRRAFDVVIAAGGTPVLAHPATLRLDTGSFEAYIGELAKYGLKGLEVYASLHSDREVEAFKAVARRYDLLCTGGSDYHGDKKGERLGYYGRDRIIPEEAADGLV